MKRFDNLIENRFFELVILRRGHPDDAKHRVPLRDVRGDAVPLDAVNKAREGSPDRRLAVRLDRRFRNLGVILDHAFDLRVHHVVLQVRRSAPNRAVHNQQRAVVLIRHGDDGRNFFARDFFVEFPVQRLKHDEMKCIGIVAGALDMLSQAGRKRLVERMAGLGRWDDSLWWRRGRRSNLCGHRRRSRGRRCRFDGFFGSDNRCRLLL